MSNTTTDRTFDAGQEFWRSRALRLLRAKHSVDTSSPQNVANTIANLDPGHVVDELFDEMLEQKDVKSEWQNRNMMVAAVDDLLFKKTKKE
jgi:hypothetical protein